MRLTRRNGIFSADQGASISPRGKQLHFGGKQAAGMNGGPRTPRTAGKRLRPAHREASLSPGRFADIAEWSWLVLVGKGAHGEREDRPPQALAGLRGGPSCGGGGLTPAPQETQARRQLCRNPELSPHCTATCKVPARPSPSGRPPPAGPVSFPCAVCIPCSRGTGQPGQGVAGWWGGLHSQPPPH